MRAKEGETMKKGLLILTMLLALTLVACDPTSTTASSASTTATTSISTATTSATTTTSITTSTTASTTTTTTEVVTTLPSFTLAQLAMFNGQNGAAAYIAVDGIVYNVTNASGWNNGRHNGILYAGTDATAAFQESPHTGAILNGLPIVGNLGAN
jgi:predicted heme/steroid binding protein